MTEYDYSPEGYERYMSTQNRVSNWVLAQNDRMHKYTNPYTNRSVSTPPASSSSSHHSSSRHGYDDRSPHRSSSSHTSHKDRPPPRRSLTTPAAPPSRSIPSHSHSRSQSQSQAPRSAHPNSNPTYYQPQPLSYGSPTYTATTHAVAYKHPQTHPQSQSTYRTYQYDTAAREIVLPPPRKGETYVIIPPTGRRVEVIVRLFFSFSSPSPSPLLSFPLSLLSFPAPFPILECNPKLTRHVAQDTTSSRSRSSSRSPQKHQQPLLKRLLGFGQPAVSVKTERHRSRSRTRSY
ncbi:hypothetical protein BDW22DRAFT_956186 [Trametopsis cervina]|nr:hypothetical protein BDW22DRAFT_956186 [Trametopsis cervina]